MPQYTSTAGARPSFETTRWTQLILVIICMVMIANLQYGWTLFVHPMAAANKWVIADIQVAFSIFVALETWLTPLDGWLATILVRSSWWQLAASAWRWAGSSTRGPRASGCSILARF
jgi:hypothetical protein